MRQRSKVPSSSSSRMAPPTRWPRPRASSKRPEQHKSLHTERRVMVRPLKKRRTARKRSIQEGRNMQNSIKDLKGSAIVATDGDIGKLDYFYFDDKPWPIRYLVADTGNWLLGRKVLLSPIAVGKMNFASGRVNVKLTKKQVEDSPSIDTDKPVSRQHEAYYHDYYGYPYYWNGPYLWGPMSCPQLVLDEKAEERRAEREEAGDLHLRSAANVTGYHIEARDGEIGHVEDFIIDAETWEIRYMVVDTRNWLPGKK